MIYQTRTTDHLVQKPLFDVRCRNCGGADVLIGARSLPRGDYALITTFLRCRICRAEQSAPEDVDGT